MSEKRILWAAIGLIVFVAAAIPVVQFVWHCWDERRYQKFEERLRNSP